MPSPSSASTSTSVPPAATQQPIVDFFASARRTAGADAAWVLFVDDLEARHAERLTELTLQAEEEFDHNSEAARLRGASLAECDRLRAENASLRSCCEVWRRRAAVHAAASLGLVGLARMARDHAVKLRGENLEMQQKLTSLKRKHEPEQYVFPLP